jgi:methionyl aminopeptidase
MFKKGIPFSVLMDPEISKFYWNAGAVAAEVRDLILSKIDVGVKLLDVAKTIESKVELLDAKLAFPVNISIDAIAAHYTPKFNDETVFEKGNVVKLDLGVHVEGFIADTAITVEVGSNKYQKMIDTAKSALDAAISEIKPGVKIEHIEGIIEDVITSNGYNPIINLSGHSLDQFKVHGGLNIHNIRKSRGKTLEKDQIIAIEPFVTDGLGKVGESKKSDIYYLLTDKPVRMRLGREILSKIHKEYKTLPFSLRALSKFFSPLRTAFVLRQLVDMKVLYNYPILKEISNGIVAQAEHTIIVDEPPQVITRSETY